MKNLKANAAVLIIIFTALLLSSSCSSSERMTRKGVKQISKCNTSFNKRNRDNKKDIARFQKNQQLYFQ